MTPTEARATMIEFLDTVAGTTDKWPLWQQHHTEALKLVLATGGPLKPRLDNLIVGQRYMIFHQSDTERRMRCSVMDYLGPDESNDRNLNFNARPQAGTQSVPRHWIKDINPVPKRTPITLNKTNW